MFKTGHGFLGRVLASGFRRRHMREKRPVCWPVNVCMFIDGTGRPGGVPSSSRVHEEGTEHLSKEFYKGIFSKVYEKFELFACDSCAFQIAQIGGPKTAHKGSTHKGILGPAVQFSASCMFSPGWQLPF
jgi:hypothetical protein